MIFTNPYPLTRLDCAFRGALERIARLRRYRIEREIAPDAQTLSAYLLAIRERPLPSIPPELQHIDEHYRNNAIVFVARHRGRPCGLLTLYTPRGQSRTLQSMGAALPPGVELDEVLDIGQLVIAPEHRGGSRLTMLSLLAAAQHHSDRVGRRYWVGATAEGLLRVFRQLNPSLVELDVGAVERSPEQARYWAAYRRDSSAQLRAFILQPNVGSPSKVLSRHLLDQIRSHT